MLTSPFYSFFPPQNQGNFDQDEEGDDEEIEESTVGESSKSGSSSIFGSPPKSGLAKRDSSFSNKSFSESSGRSVAFTYCYGDHRQLILITLLLQ